jgi:hypothetical protein
MTAVNGEFVDGWSKARSAMFGRTGGQRQMKSFPTCAGQRGAKEFAEALVKELANNSPAVMLSDARRGFALHRAVAVNDISVTSWAPKVGSFIPLGDPS